MVNPVYNQVPGMPIGVPAADFERPAAIPEPAVQVTASAENRHAGGATDSPRDGSHYPGNPNSLDKALEEINESMQAWATGMRFDVDEEAQRVVVSIIDNKTGEVVRTVPSDAVLRVAKMIVQLQGQTIDTRV